MVSCSSSSGSTMINMTYNPIVILCSVEGTNGERNHVTDQLMDPSLC